MHCSRGGASLFLFLVAGTRRYLFDGEENKRYTLTSSGFTVMQVVAPDEVTTVAENDKGHAISWVCPAKGGYFLVISSRGHRTGQYTVSVSTF